MTQSKKLRILIINRWVGYNEGGNETHIKELALFLSRRGHQISIMTTGTEALNLLTPHLYNIFDIPSPKLYFSLQKNRLVNVLQSAAFLIRAFCTALSECVLKGNKYDVVSVHFSLEAVLARVIRWLLGIPYILVLVGDTDFELVEGKYADCTIQISNFMADECKAFGYRPQVLPKGVDRERFNLSVPRTERNNLLKSPDTERLVIAVCRLDPRKDLQTLLEAVQLTKKTHPFIKYLIVGGGTEWEKLSTLICKLELQDHIRLYGAVPSGSDLLPKLYRAADLFALPTLYEGFGYVFSEAMACGLPVISTDTSAVPEVVADVGIIVPVRQPQLLAENIIKVLTDNELRLDLINKGTKKVEAWYWDQLIDRYEQAYFQAATCKENLARRTIRFLRSLASTGYLLKKLTGFVTKPELLKWGPTDKSQNTV